MEFAEFIQTPKIDNVVLRHPFEDPVEGTLCVTGHHLILSSRQEGKEELWLLHNNIDSVEKKLSGSSGTLTIKCKDFKWLMLDIPQAEDCLGLATSIEQLSNIDNVGLAYPFFYRPMFEIMEDGWHAFHPETEFSRLIGRSEEWRLCHVNKNFEVCQSYPQAVVVPKTIDDETVVRVAQFRQYGRFPVLSYYHKDNGTVIMRSSQPLTGPNGRRCKDDERMVNAVLGIGKRGYIVDTRSSTVAKMAQAKGGGVEPDVYYPQWRKINKLESYGGGVEPEVHYPQWRKINQAVERHHALHDSLIKLLEACYEPGISMDKWLSKVESSNWLSHVKSILTCACVVAQCIDQEGASVLVHGSSGIDSTLQVTSLAQLILDHDCRTVRGLEALVEREWLQAGHMFSDRCSKSAFAITKHRNEAPVFLLFLDAVWQIWQQFPCSFEFNEDFLIVLFQHAYCSQFGTFLCNNEYERKKHNLAQKTVSLWSYINRPENLTKYLNPLYEPNMAVIWPSVAAQSLKMWSGLYQRWLQDQTAREEVWHDICRMKEQDKELRSKVTRLRRQLASLEKEAINANLIPQMPGGDN